MNKKNILIGLGIVLTIFSQVGHATEIKVKMLNSGEKGAIMVFEPSYVKANVGDTISFEPTQAGGHNVKSLITPSNTKEFTSKPDTAFSYKLEKEGVYLYACEPHKSMGMIGLIQVGKPTNLSEVKKIVETEQPKLIMNKEAYKNILDKIK